MKRSEKIANAKFKDDFVLYCTFEDIIDIKL